MSLGFEPLCTRFQNASPIYRGARGEKPVQTVLGDRPHFSCRPFHMLGSPVAYSVRPCTHCTWSLYYLWGNEVTWG